MAKKYQYPLTDLTKQNNAIIQLEVINSRLNQSTKEVEKTSEYLINLYAPGNLQFADGAQFNSTDIGFTGRAVEKAILEQNALGSGDVLVSSVLDSSGAAMTETLRASRDLALGNALSAALATRVMEKVPGISRTDFAKGIKSSLRYTANPHTRVLFNNVNLRDFTFTWDLFPESEDEAAEIKEIIKVFRSTLYPEYYSIDDEIYGLTGAERERAKNLYETAYSAFEDEIYKFPSTVKPKILYYSHQLDEFLDIGPKFQECFIENVQTTFDPDSTMSWHADGSPVKTQLSVKLIEDRTLNKNDILKGGY